MQCWLQVFAGLCTNESSAKFLPRRTIPGSGHKLFSPSSGSTPLLNQITQEFKAGQAKQACLKECIQAKKDHEEFVEGELWSRPIVLVTSQFISSKDPARHLLRIEGSEKQAVKKHSTLKAILLKRNNSTVKNIFSWLCSLV